ncbi:hypothetical protein QJS04_geneDACA019266 [Acorus gramineus]|uniref:DUF676 domain-containing protein n=1 Tax=Acorus gramineus TaxID=55184 RepID=A0AAV9A3S1_ACOGR|nr:hypothetical protein QJS04_geneDACA019266 [Acorus gramineus]
MMAKGAIGGLGGGESGGVGGGVCCVSSDSHGRMRGEPGSSHGSMCGAFGGGQGGACDDKEVGRLTVAVNEKAVVTEGEVKSGLTIDTFGAIRATLSSSSNTYTKTFTGIDGAGKRLADEVMQVVRSIGSLKRISFLAHSLGGLFARYAVGVLYSSNPLNNVQLDDLTSFSNDG